MLRFKNVLEVINQANWEPVPNMIYMIKSVASLKEFLKNDFPELSKLDFTISNSDNPTEYSKEWDQNRPEFKNFIDKMGLKSYYSLRSIFSEDLVDKKGGFYFTVIYIFKLRYNDEDVYIYENAVVMPSLSKKPKKTTLNDALLNFRDYVVTTLTSRFEHKLLVSVR